MKGESNCYYYLDKLLFADCAIHWNASYLWDLTPLQWRHNGRGSVSNHLPHDCSLNYLFRRRSKEISKFRVTGLCAGNSPGTIELPEQMAGNAENVSIWWRHHVIEYVISINHRGSAKAICKCGFVFRLRQDMYSLRRLITRSHKKSWWCEGSEGLKISYIFTICRMLLLWRLLNFR